jgi:enamine deaminase RidA (YjgF/YER057c/UK114 family)
MTFANPLDFFTRENIDLGFVPKPAGSYAPVNIRQNIAYVAIQFPIAEKGFLYTGILGRTLTTEQGYQAARHAAINVLAQIHHAVGFERIEGLNHVDIYYRCDETWDEGTVVANGASDLFLSALGPRGAHTRSLFGVHSFPKNLSVGITASFTLKY